MKGKIGLEEHYALEDTLEDSRPFVPPNLWPEARARLLDFQERRIAEMDRWGMELMLLSLNAPAIQAIPDRKKAMDISVRSNDLMAAEIAKNPKRFQGLAALAMQDPDHACKELERCVKQLGFRGILVNGFSQIDDPENCVYLDDPRYRPFWALVSQLDVPFYLHPRNPLVSQSTCYKGAEWLLGPKWGFGNETAVHALRLMGSGIFDTHPHLKIIIGHMGEGIPFSLWRIDNHNAWMNLPNPYPAKHKLSYYFQNNFWITVSGNFTSRSFSQAITGAASAYSGARRWGSAAAIGTERRKKSGASVVAWNERGRFILWGKGNRGRVQRSRGLALVATG